MEAPMKRFFVFSIFLVLIFMLTGCSQLMRNRAEIDRIFNTRIVAIDKLEENKVLYTISTKAAVPNTQQQGTIQRTSEFLVSEGTTVFEAARNMAQYAHRRPHYGHTEFIIFGEDTAKAGILPYLDFISRNQEFRYNAKIYIIQGYSANSFITSVSTESIFLADRLSILEDNSFAQSRSGKVTLSEALFILSKDNVATFLPVIIVAPSKEGPNSTDGAYDLILKSYAVFKEDKLQDFLNEELSRGVNWVKDRTQSGTILVDAPDKKKVSLEIIQSKTSIKPYMDESGLQCTIGIKFNTNIAESLSSEDIFTIEVLESLKQQQEEQVETEVKKILSYAQERNMDIFGLVSNFSMKYPMMKNELRENWPQLFPEIKFNVEIDSNINRTYLIKDPATSK
jgi:spore germination protein KC